MAYIDHTAEEAVIQHIQRCPACTRQAEELATFQAILTAKLHRVSCPKPDQLIAYHQRELQGSEKLIVAQHLRQCPHCARELAALARDERIGLGERVRAAIEVLDAVLVTPQRPQGCQIQAAGVRGAPEAARPTPQVYRAYENEHENEIEIIVNQRPSRTHPRRWDLSGLVHIGGQVPETIGRATVELYRGEGLIAITKVSSRGQFTFTAVEPAGYDLSLVWEDREVRLKGVQVE